MPAQLCRFALAVSILAGCATDDPAERYIGTWSYYRSTVETYCQDQPDVSQDLVGNIVLTSPGYAELAIDIASQRTLAAGISDGCVPKFRVGETQADLVPQETCFLETPTGTHVRLSYDAYQLRPAHVSGPNIEPETPALLVTLEAKLWNENGSCRVESDATVIPADS